MTVALRKQHDLSAVVPVDNAPVDAALKSDFGDYLKGMQAVEDAKIDKQSDADKSLQRHESNLAIRQFLLTNLGKPSPDSKTLKFRIPLNILAKAIPHLGDFPFKDPEKARFEGPALFIRGTKSHYVADEFLPLIGQFFPQFELLDVNCGHWVISERPDEFCQGLLEFLQRKVASE